MSADKRIALTVIGGFLGAGKSTLLNRILHTSQRRTVVLVNDFGSVNVDLALVKRCDGDTISLSNGCACCSLSGGLYEALARAMARQPVPQWIVIEASGVAEPARIAQVGMSDPMLELESVLVVVDASNIRQQASDSLLTDTITRQLTGASVLLLSKTELAGVQETTMVKQWLARQVPGVPVVLSGINLDQLPMHISAENVEQIARAVEHHHDENGHDDEQGSPPFVSWFWSPKQTVSAQRLTAVLKSLPRSIVRAKGWLNTDRHGQVLVQFVSGRIRYTVTEQAIPVPDGLVLIGAGNIVQQDINNIMQTTVCKNR